MVKIYNRLHKAIGTLTYFTMHSWEWSYSNLDMLTSHMSPEDKKVTYKYNTISQNDIFKLTRKYI